VVGAERQSDPEVIELIERVKDTDIFLRMAVLELRRIAERSPEIAVELQRIARQLEAEVDERDTSQS
jgi:hypothetical protein